MQIHIVHLLLLAICLKTVSCQTIQNVQRRFKRQNAEEDCVLKCSSDMQSKLELTTPNFKTIVDQFQSGQLRLSILKDNQILTYCEQVYKSYVGCIEKCPASKLKGIMTKAFQPVNYACIQHYTDFKKYLPCLRNAEADIESDCANKTCLASKPDLKGLAPKTNSSLVKDLNRFRKDMKQNCEYNKNSSEIARKPFIKCMMPCQRPMLSRFCGKDGETFYQNLVTLTLRSVKETLIDSDLEFMWPDDCNFI